MKHDKRKLYPFVRKAHALGWSDEETAWEYRQRTGTRTDRHAIGMARKVLGLPSNRFSAHVRRRVAETTKYQLKAEDAESLAELRVRSFRAAVARTGWPLDLTPREAQILTLLEASPDGLTRPEIAAGLGLPWHGCRRSLKSRRPQGSHLAYLTGRGLVEYRSQKSDGEKVARSDGVMSRRRAPGRYVLAAGVKRRAFGNSWAA